MSNKTDLIQKLRNIANELEQDLKPICIPQCEPEVGKYHLTSVGSLYFIESINGNKCYGYGIDYHSNWKTGFVCYTENIKQLTTESEVKEALTKEAVKKYKGKKFIESRTNSNKYDFDKDFESFYFNGDTLCIKIAGNGTLFYNGIWATVIKERSLEEWRIDYCKQSNQLTHYMKQTKTELIEILNNLDNEK